MGSCFYFLSSGFEETNEALVEAGAPHLPGTLACTLIQQGSPELSRILNHLASHGPRIKKKKIQARLFCSKNERPKRIRSHKPFLLVEHYQPLDLG